MMDFNPHSLNQILVRIRDQMRCPQCGTRVPVDFPSIKLAGDTFMLLQLRCESCTAFIVLHVNLSDQERHDHEKQQAILLNASSTVSLTEEEMTTLRTALKKYDGSFEMLFKEYGREEYRR